MYTTLQRQHTYALFELIYNHRVWFLLYLCKTVWVCINHGDDEHSSDDI